MSIRVTLKDPDGHTATYDTENLPLKGDLVNFHGLSYEIEDRIWKIPEFTVMLFLRNRPKQ
jgi:hypothetical protein